MKASQIIKKYIDFFIDKNHKQIINSPLVPENDPTTLFTSSGMQPLINYFFGEKHPLGKRLVNVQNCFRAADLDEVGDNRHTTFFRMLGNWSLGDYFKEEQLNWIFDFLTNELKLSPEKLYVSVFKGYKDIPKDEESERIWLEIFKKAGLKGKERIFYYGAKENWWSRSGSPENMPEKEPGGPDSEVFYDFGDEKTHQESQFKKGKCHMNCQCGRFLEIGNSVFMQFQKKNDGFGLLPQRSVDFGGGLERLIAAIENKCDIFQTSLILPVVKKIEEATGLKYEKQPVKIRIIADHLIASSFIIASGIVPSNKEQGYVLRRLIRRATDNLPNQKIDIQPIIDSIVSQYSDTDPYITASFEKIKNVLLEEQQKYEKTKQEAKAFIVKKYKNVGEELMGTKEISADDAFLLYSTHGLSPSQIKSLGYTFNGQEFVQKMEAHQNLSRKGAGQRFKGGLADTSEKTVAGHTATHLLHQALKDVLGKDVYQMGSNITDERIRFDFKYDQRLTEEEIKKIEKIVNEKIKENLKISEETMSLRKAKEEGAIGIFADKYQDQVKVYTIGSYSKEICGGPHVDFTGKLKSFKIIKQENIGQMAKRLYAKVG